MVPLTEQFVGVDSEGQDWLGQHRLMFVRAGNDILIHKYKEKYLPLTSHQILTFLGSLPKNKTYVGFSLSYDMTMWIKTLDPATIYSLLHRELRAYMNNNKIQYKKVIIPNTHIKCDMVIGKWFAVKLPGRSTIVIHDVFSFFQSSFLKAVEAWGIATPNELRLIQAGKERRGGKLTLDDIEYNRLECELLERLMTLFAEQCKKAGIVPKVWQGPGLLASQLFIHHNVPKGEDCITI